MRFSAKNAIFSPFRRDKDVPPTRTRGEKGTGPICRNGPKGASHKLDLSPFLPHTTEGVALNGQRSVLIVDRSAETREVLQTALEHRGVRTLAAGRTATGMELARRHQPDLIVLDLELDDAPDCLSAGQAFCLPVGQAFLPAKRQTGMSAPQSEYQPHLVLLGNLRGWRDRLPEGEFVSKPYHYGPLIRKIEELLVSDTQARNGDGSDLCAAPFGPCRQIGPVPISRTSGEFGTCRRYSSSAEPTRATASS